MEVSRYVENLKTKFVNIDDKKKLLEEITKQLAPKTMEKKEFGEVFTPLKIVEDMLNTLPEKVWTNPSLTFLEPGSGLGNFTICVFYRLMDGLKTAIPDAAKRERHIIEKMLYMAELNKANVHICKGIFKAKKNGYKLNLYEGDFLELDPEKEWGIDKFDVIVGNPPYNSGLGASGKTIYHKFVEKCVNICRYLLFIIPSRWFAGGKGLDQFRKMMLSRKDIEYINHFNDSKEIFNNVDIKGGVNYFLIDSSYNGLCNFNGNDIDLSRYDILVTGVQNYSIIDKILKFKSVSDIYLGRHFGIETNDSRLHDSKSSENNILCYVSQQNGSTKYINKKYIIKDYNFWKVITARAAGKGNDGFGNLFIGKPDEIHNSSYVSFRVKTEEEANSLLSFLKTNLANFMLSLRKISQDINEETVSWIPLPPLDRIWNNLDTYKYFDFTERQVKQIEDHIGIFTGNKLNDGEIASLKNPEKSYANAVKTPAKKLVRVDKLKQSAGYSQSTSIEPQKTDKLQYILQNVHKIDITYSKFKYVLVKLGVSNKDVSTFWEKYYLQLKN